MANSIKKYFKVLPKSFEPQFDLIQDDKKEPSASSHSGLLPNEPKLNSERLNGAIRVLTVRATKIHEKLKVNDVVFKCKKCPKIFKTFRLMRDHNRKFHPTKRVSCSLCKLRFVNRSSMLTHKDIHHESKNGKPKPFQCDHCAKSYDIKFNMIFHLRSHLRPEAKGIQRRAVADGSFIYKCDLCTNVYRHRKSLRDHKEIYHESKQETKMKYKCGDCSRSFATKQNLNRHWRLQHLRVSNNTKNRRRFQPDELGLYPCDACEKVFKQGLQLRDHKELEHGWEDALKKKFQCDECTRSFCTVSILKRHSAREHKLNRKRLSVRPSPDEFGTFSCDACEKVFGSYQALNNHKDFAHESESQLTKTYLCEFCPRSFNIKENLHNHLKAQHSSEPGIIYLKKPKARKYFRCEDCKMVFTNGSNLQKHIGSTHPPENGTGKHLCEYCAVSFRFKRNLYRHLVSEHLQFDKSTRRTCKVCDQTFNTQQNLHRHQDYRHHIENAKPKAHQCTNCPQSFCLKENFRRHMSSKHQKSCEQLRCKLCQNKFANRKGLRLHQDYSHPEDGGSLKAYQCDHCPRSFEIKYNMKRHWNSKHKPRQIQIVRKPDAYGKYPCDLCEEYFKTHLYLRDHKEIHHQLEGDGQERKFKCKKCSKTYSTRSILIRHLESAHKQARKQVYESGKRFRFRPSIDFMCDECGKACFDQSRLNEHTELFHETSTSEQKRHQCTQCSSSFNFINNLKRHMKEECLHSKETKRIKKDDTENRRSTRLSCNTMLLKTDVEPEIKNFKLAIYN